MNSRTIEDGILAAVEDAERAFPHGVVNAGVVLDDVLTNRTLRALSYPVPPELALRTQPLVRFSLQPDGPVLPLVAAMMAGPAEAAVCDRCDADARSRHSAALTLGATVVVTYLCDDCAALWDLVWE